VESARHVLQSRGGGGGAMSAVADVAAVRLAGGTMSDDLRAVRMVWRREIIRFFRNRVRILTSLAQPLVFLFVLGSGLSPVVRTGGVGTATSGFDFRTFMFPGVVAMTVLFTAIFSAVSIVWDREFGFLREMLVAPVRRGALVAGKCLGGASVATLQGVIMLLLAPLVHVPLSPVLMVQLVFEMAIAAFVLTAFGILLASRMQQVESFQVVMQFFVLPMFFLSGAVFPLSGLPSWLTVLAKIDPLSYAVDPMRRAVFAAKHLPAALQQRFNPGMTWSGWRVPTLIELALVVVLGVVMLGVAVYQFSKPE
jgi:ABC-2 type transport system permease protein